MIEPTNYKELDELLGKTFWTFGYYIGPYSYKLDGIRAPQEVVLEKEDDGRGSYSRYIWYPLKNKYTNQIVGYYSLTQSRNNYKLYESKEEAIEQWNISIQDHLDRLDSDYERKKKYLNNKFIKK